MTRATVLLFYTFVSETRHYSISANLNETPTLIHKISGVSRGSTKNICAERQFRVYGMVAARFT